MAQELKLKITVDGSGNIVIEKTEEDIKRLGKTAKKTASELDDIFKKVLGYFSATAIGYAVLKLGEDVMALNEKLNYVGRQANLTSDQILQLKRELFDVAMATHQGPDALLDAINSIVEKTGDVNLAAESLYSIGVAASASGAKTEHIGSVVADLSQKFHILAKDMGGALDVLYVQGKVGAFTLQDLATQGERVTSAAARMNLTGIEGVRVMGALLQVIKQGVGSPEMAATTFEAIIRDMIQNADKIKELTGVLVFDESGNPRRIDKVLKEIIAQVGNDLPKLQEMFKDEGLKGVSVLFNMFKDTGNFAELDKFIASGGDMVQLLEDAAKRGEEASSKFQNLKTSLLAVGDAFAPVIDGVATLSTELGEKFLRVAAGALRAFGYLATMKSKNTLGSDETRATAKELADWANQSAYDIIDTADRLAGATGDYSKSLDQAADAAKKMAQAEQENARALEETEKAAANTRKAFEDMVKDGFSKLAEQRQKYIDAKADQFKVDQWYYQANRKLAEDNFNKEISQIYQMVEAKKQLARQSIQDGAGLYGNLFSYNPDRYADKAATASMQSSATDETIRRQYEMADAVEKQDLAMSLAMKTVGQYFPALDAGSYDAQMKMSALADKFKAFYTDWTEKEKAFKLEVEDKATPVIDALEKRLLEVTGKVYVIKIDYSTTGAPLANISLPQVESSHAGGLPYAPRDMTIRIHKGESVVTADKTQAAGGITFGDININLPPNSGTLNSPQDWRQTTRDVIIPEIITELARKGGEMRRLASGGV